MSTMSRSLLNYTPWRTRDGITHIGWRERREFDATHFIVCRPWGLPYNEGQDVGNATITCIRCLGQFLK